MKKDLFLLAKQKALKAIKEIIRFLTQRDNYHTEEVKKDLFLLAKQKALKAINEKIRFLTQRDNYHTEEVKELLRERQKIKFTTNSKCKLVGFSPAEPSQRKRGKFRTPSRNKILRDKYLNRK
jgi:Mn-containing catalase